MTERTVHAWFVSGSTEYELARYARAGTWWLEAAGQPRQRVTVAGAVALLEQALAFSDEDHPAGWIPAVPGGVRFDALVRPFWPAAGAKVTS